MYEHHECCANYTAVLMGIDGGEIRGRICIIGFISKFVLTIVILSIVRFVSLMDSL